MSNKQVESKNGDIAFKKKPKLSKKERRELQEKQRAEKAVRKGKKPDLGVTNSGVSLKQKSKEQMVKVKVYRFITSVKFLLFREHTLRNRLVYFRIYRSMKGKALCHLTLGSPLKTHKESTHQFLR